MHLLKSGRIKGLYMVKQWSSKGQELEATSIVWYAYKNNYNHAADFVSGKKVPTLKVYSRPDAECCVVQPVASTNAEQKLARKSELKARGTLLMALPDKHQLKFNSHKDAKTLMEAIKKRFGRNTETKKVQKTLLKQQYENFIDVNLNFLCNLPSEWKTHTLIWRNKADLEEQSLDDLFNSLKIYEAEVKHSSSTGTTTQNLAFVSSSNTDSTPDSISAAVSVYVVCAKIHVSSLPNVDSLKMDLRWHMAMLTMRAIRFLQKTGKNLGANGPTSMGFDMSKVKCYNCHRKGHFARECRSLKDSRRNGSYDWSYQAEEEPANFTLMAFSASSSFFDTESDYESWPPNSLYDRFQPSGRYHDVPPLYIGTFMPPKPDLVFTTTPTAVETDHIAFNVQLSPTKPAQDLSHTNRPTAPIIEDWVSDSEDESETKASQIVLSFVQSSEQVKTPRNSVQPVETSIPAATPKPASPMSNSSGKRRNRKACFVCKSVDHLIKDYDFHAKKMAQPTPRNYAHRGNHKQYASLTHPNPQKHMVSAAVLTHSKPVSITAVRPVSAAVPKIMVTRPRLTYLIVTKSKSPIRRHITRSQSQKTRVIDSGCSRNMTGNMSYVSDYEELNDGYLAFGGNPKGGKISDKGKIKTCKLDFKDVYFVKKLKFNLFSVSQMCDKKNSVLFTDTECLVLSFDFKLPDESQVLLRVPRENNIYNVNLKNIVPSRDLTCLFVKEIIDKSNLWHRRLTHINFKTINKLVKGNLVRGLPTKVFETDNTCVACKKGKQHRASCKTKPVSSVDQPLFRLHMDLFGPTFVKSLNKKSYCLVVTNDYSRFTWVFFLATKDETGPILKTFITGLENQLSLKVLVTKPHNKTPYELLHGRTPSIGFMRPFGYPVTILNTLDPLGKFKGKVDEGFLVGYSAKGKSPVESFTGYKDLNVEFEDCSDNSSNEVNATELEDIIYSDVENDVGAEADFNNLETSITFKKQKFYILVDLPHGKRAIGTKWVFRNKNDKRGIMVRNKARLVTQGHTQEEGIDYKEVFAPKARIKAIRLFLAYASFMGFMVCQMDVKSEFLYETIKKEVYVYQPLGFEDPDHPEKVYKVVKALYSLHQAHKAWYETLANYLLENGFQRGKIDQTLFIKKQKGDILLQQKDRIFINQHKYVAEILRKFGLTEGKSASTLIDTEKPLLKDPDGEDVDVHTYRKSTTRGCQFLGCRLIFWQCKKQIVVATSSTKAEYVATASCCGRQAESQAEIYRFDMDHASKVLSMHEDEPAEVQEVVDVVTTSKLITEVVTAASETVTVASAIISTVEPQVPAATITAAPARVAAAPSRKRKGVVIRDPEKESTTSSIISTKTKSKDKGKGIMVEEPKPLKKKQQIKMDEEYTRKLHAELNKDIDWDVAIDHNVAVFKLDYIKGMSYDNIRPIFEAKFNSNVDFLQKIIKQMEEEESRALQTINETLAEKAANRRKLNEEVEDLKRHLEIVPDEDDDVYTKATPLARKVPVVDYDIIEINNKPYYKIIRAYGTHQLYISFLTLLKNFYREDLEAL
uniref:Ribonuclease H-like domain-containing protein n=1 Tax=Tanacetum cinerariifolium TaxID=118510 RepID=A0A6L2KN48_TANCI|nr:ribonuclease H-like domain-containing protein [Tanacetum cinerariifolium]